MDLGKKTRKANQLIILIYDVVLRRKHGGISSKINGFFYNGFRTFNSASPLIPMKGQHTHVPSFKILITAYGFQFVHLKSERKMIK